MKERIKLGIVEDNNIFTESLRQYFRVTGPVEVVFFTFEKEEIVKLCKKHQPDVLLMDINLGYFSGIEGLKLVKESFPHIKILMCTVFSDNENLFEAIAQGASGYILKTTPAAEIELAIIETFNGGAPITPQVASQLFLVFRQNNIAQLASDGLTSRENEILGALVRGLSYKEVAQEMNISMSTVRTHVEHIYAKLEVNSKAEAVAKYLKTSR
ncbi:MAG: DNA-binding response regulator [Cytophagales bacterium CG18_big_fil_WC_8_21_14_2_50_42_9]|nr:MAG: DNA-binding response regulator [Cytophagales bacterium CG18_big_fil_WC_8_21_14_2_50_42_9]